MSSKYVEEEVLRVPRKPRNQLESRWKILLQQILTPPTPQLPPTTPTPPLRAGNPNNSIIDIWGQLCLCWWWKVGGGGSCPVCIVRYLTASLANTHWMLVPSPICDNHKHLQRWPNVLWGTKLPPVETHELEGEFGERFIHIYLLSPGTMRQK